MRGRGGSVINAIAHDGGLERPETSAREYSRKILFLAHRSAKCLGEIVRPPPPSNNPLQTGGWGGRIDKQYPALLNEKLEQGLGTAD